VSWLAAAVDKRVQSLIPIVADMKIQEVVSRQYEIYGGPSYAMRDYIQRNITNWLNTPEFGSMMAYIDPFSYKDNLVQPALIVSASGDEFFLPDDSRSFFPDLVGPKYLQMLPNSSHFISTAVPSIVYVQHAHRHMIRF
jgi:PhoPQ-activated pathogenicity-related protein